MSIGIIKILRALLLSVLLSAVCLLLLSAFAVTRESPESFIVGGGRGTLFLSALLAGFFGAKSNSSFFTGLLTATLLLVAVLLCAPLFSVTSSHTEKYILLAIALACGTLGSLIGSRRRVKAVRRRKKARR